jgi:hypothetical protein
LSGLVNALVKAQQWEQAEKLATTIKQSYKKARVLLQLAERLLHYPENNQQLEALILRSWLEATTRDYLLELLPMANPIIKGHTHLALEFVEGIHKVDAFLQAV